MQLVPLAASPSQTIAIVLAGQNCQISVYYKTTGIFMDLAVNGVQLLSTRLAVNGAFMVASAYLGFIGNLVFIDAQGRENPDYTQFGTRFYLIYAEATDL